MVKKWEKMWSTCHEHGTKKQWLEHPTSGVLTWEHFLSIHKLCLLFSLKTFKVQLQNTQQNITTLRKWRKNKYFIRKAFVFFGLHIMLVIIYPFNKNQCYLESFTSLKIIVKPQQWKCEDWRKSPYLGAL